MNILNKINKNTRYLILCILIILLLIIILLKILNNKKVQIALEQEKQRVSQYTAISDFKSINDVALYLNCNFIKQKDSSIENIKYELYMELPIQPIDNEKSNEIFYTKLMQYLAYVLEYENFIIIDEKNEINVYVYCNKDTKQISTYYINGTEKLFDVKENENNLNEFTKINEISVNITSTILSNIIENNWKTNGLEIGTIETTYKNYDVYFDEGIEIRNVNGKVFNLIFNEKYKEYIINNITSTSKKEEIIKSLGMPHFEYGNLIGYKCKNIYIFFYDNQVSIYRIEKYETEKIAQLIEKYSKNDNVEDFIKEIQKEWKDYDKYEASGNNIILKYSLKGLCIKYNSSKQNGVVFYNNYDGYAYGNTTLEEYIKSERSLPNNIYIKNENLVFENEKNRINSLDDYTAKYNYTTKSTLNTSNEFKIYSTLGQDKEHYEIKFISIGNKFPSSELREKINMGIWVDDYNFAYAVNGSGIYLYNAKERIYKTIINGNGKYIIKKIENNKIYYNDTCVEIQL